MATPRPGGKESSASFQAVFYLFLGLIMVLGVIFSSSRAGILSVMIAVFALAVLSVLKASSKTWAVWVLGFVTLMVGFGL